MSNKPDRISAILNIIEQVKRELPLHEEDTFVCGDGTSCIGCPKKLMELVDTEVTYWESAIQRGIIPGFDDIRKFGKLCTNVKRGLIRNNLV